MIKKRIIGLITIKNGLVVQSFGYNKFLPIGKPEIVVKNLDRWGADEIMINVIDRSHQNKGPDFELLNKLKPIGINTPIIYSGGISSLKEALKVLAHGADRILLESIVSNNFLEFKKLSSVIGAQSILISLPLNLSDKKVLRFYEYKNQKVIDIPENFILALKESLCSEIVLIDYKNQGLKDKFNIDILNNFKFKNIRIIVYGGINSSTKVKRLIKDVRVVAVGFGNSLNYAEHQIQTIKGSLSSKVTREPNYLSET